METILRSGEMAEIILLPIRHHSPACAWHVREVIRRKKPVSILVEGPENANPLIPVMTHADTRAPFAVYYSYRDRTGRISDEKKDYKCYYPFLDYSPELAALREGVKLGIYTAFIDLPYGDILSASRLGRGLLKDEEKSNYNDDHLLAENRMIGQLCEKAGVRNFDEFWEKYFELNGIREESEALFSHLYTYCSLARESTPEHVLVEEGCLEREKHMAARIVGEVRKLAGTGNGSEKDTRPIILVITGGFHTPGLLARLKGEEIWEADRDAETAKSVPIEDQSVYPMPYSMEAADALNGYASGMPFPGFYQKVWERLTEGDGHPGPYSQTVLDFLVSAGRDTRKKEGCLSTYDEICAYSMADGLAALRDKAEPGAYELLDAVLSSFIKGEWNLSTDTPLRLLRSSMTGGKLGRLCEAAAVPPIVRDFEMRAKTYGIEYRTSVERESTLSLFSSKKHRQMSMFFHRMDYLNTGFAKRVKGPDLQNRKDRNYLREIWKYRWSTGVMAALIDESVRGATVEEACVSLVGQTLKKELGAKDAAILMTRVFEMGLGDQLKPVYDRLYALILADTDFFSLASALTYLLMLQELENLYRSGLDTEGMLPVCVQKLVTLLPSMASVKDENLTDCMKTCKLIFQLTGREGYEGLQRLYETCLKGMVQDENLHPGLHGCICGLLYGIGSLPVDGVKNACRGYLTGTKDQQLKTAIFFRGLFYTARDLVFIGDEFLSMLDGFLAVLDDGEFLTLLPELKLAFASFTPREIDRIAGSAAGLHGEKPGDFYKRHEVLPGWRSYGSRLDTYVKEKMEGVHDGG